ncbi:MAG: ribonuclease P protein component [Candidatus Moranbacteria bacterium]|nr:ribonuclease P protein component [Candidatus Moranbacteria bacterium]
MLPAESRLKSKKDIEEVFRKGRTVKSSFLFLRYAHNNLEQTRIAFSVGLRYSKKAVSRNRAKRVLRESAREFLPEINPGYDLVFFLDKNFKDELMLSQTKEKMAKTLEQASLLKQQ